MLQWLIYMWNITHDVPHYVLSMRQCCHHWQLFLDGNGNIAGFFVITWLA